LHESTNDRAGVDNAVTTAPLNERSKRIVQVLWLVNVTAFLGLVVWILSDGQFSTVTEMLRARIYAVLERGLSALAYTWYARRVFALAITGVVAAVSFVGIFLALFFGAASHRRVRSWFAFTLLLAAWLALLGSWHELAWRGQVFRFQGRISGYDTVAESLRNNWPNIDGERPNIGPFMAYPIGNPTMLMMLRSPDVPGTKSSFTSVERGDDGTLRFELVGDEPNSWLEWHPRDSVPASFTGGLENEYALDRYTRLRNDWFLARYRPTFNSLR
jgi:hypothetical protein